MSAPGVREGGSVDIEIDSGAKIGADTCPLLETRLSMVGGHHVAAGGKLHELGAGIFGWKLPACEAML